MTGSSGTGHRGPSAPNVEPRSPARENWVRSEEDEFYWQGDSADVRHDPPESMARQSYALRAMRQKDHVSAGLFAVFMGLFGMHKFYLGYYKTGFIMLAVSIIGGICSLGLATAVVWVIAIIEGIIYLSKTQTDFDRIYVLNDREWF